MNLKFNHLNKGATIVNPTITVDKDTIQIDWNTKVVKSVLVLLETPNGSKFGVELTDMLIEDSALSFTPSATTKFELWAELGQAVNLDSMVVTELQKYIVS